jgi:sarcosine oxidase subunit alpha
MTGFRLPSGGHVDRNRHLAFSFDGRRMQGHPGDTLASALLANGAGVIARSLKYHRPRGIYAAGLEDPCAMLAVTDRHGRDPAIRAGQVVLIDGLKSESVTGWPSPGLDLAAPFTRALAPILTAGFYYKTLKWPNWSWYEPFVRRATGFGRPLGRPDRRRRARRYDTCDVLIVGAGPAGLAAAAALTGSGRDVVLADQEPQPGGSLRWENARIDGRKGYVWAEDVRTAFEEGGGRYLQSTSHMRSRRKVTFTPMGIPSRSLNVAIDFFARATTGF